MCSGVASMEQMEQLLPPDSKDHFCISCRSDEIFCRGRGGGTCVLLTEHCHRAMYTGTRLTCLLTYFSIKLVQIVAGEAI